MICLYDSQGNGMDQDLTQFAVLIICDNSTGCDETGDHFTIEADTMIDIVFEVCLNKNWFWIFIFNRNMYYIVSLKCETIIFYIYFSIICIRIYVIKYYLSHM